MRQLLARFALVSAVLLATVALVTGGYVCYLLLATDLADALRYEFFRPLLRPSPVGLGVGQSGDTVYIADQTTLCFWVIDPKTDQVVDRFQPSLRSFEDLADRLVPGMAWWAYPDLETVTGKRYRIEVERAEKSVKNFVRVDVYPPGAQQPSSSVDFSLTKHPDYVYDVVMTLASPSKLYVLIGYSQVASFDEKGQIESLPSEERAVYFYVVDTTTDWVTRREILWSSPYGWLRIWTSPFGKVYVIQTESADVKVINAITDEVKTITLSPLMMPSRQ